LQVPLVAQETRDRGPRRVTKGADPVVGKRSESTFAQLGEREWLAACTQHQTRGRRFAD